MNQIVIHMKKSALDHIKELQLTHFITNDEIDVIVDEFEYRDGNDPSQDGVWEDPDVQLCNDLGINYNLVNCIELEEVPL